MTTPRPASLRIDELRIGYGDEQVVHIRHLQLRPGTLTALLGPVAAGKSTLLRQLSGDNSLIPASWSHGAVLVDDVPIQDTPAHVASPPCVAMLPQKARLYLGTVRSNLQQPSHARADTRLMALLETLDRTGRVTAALDTDVGSTSMAIHRATLITRLLLGHPGLLLLDEPLSDVAIADETWLLDLIRAAATLTTVVFVTHNKNHARRIADDVALVTGGCLVEHTPASRFFDQPATDLGRRFLESGSAWPDMTPDPEPVASPSAEIPAAAGRPLMPNRHLGLRWIVRGRIGGMHKPGLIGDLAGDLEAITALGVDHLVTLTELPLEDAPNVGRPLRIIHFPIDDMAAPEPMSCATILSSLGNAYDAGANIVFHCRGGLGRTGLMLACFLIAHRDMPGEQAIEHVRKVNPNYIQSDAQLDFVMDFARRLA